MKNPQRVPLLIEPVFTQPTWRKALVLALGTLLGHGRRTVAAALRQMGHAHDPAFSGFRQVLNRTQWSGLALKPIRKIRSAGLSLRADAQAKAWFSERLSLLDSLAAVQPPSCQAVPNHA